MCQRYVKEGFLINYAIILIKTFFQITNVVFVKASLHRKPFFLWLEKLARARTFAELFLQIYKELLPISAFSILN